MIYLGIIILAFILFYTIKIKSNKLDLVLFLLVCLLGFYITIVFSEDFFTKISYKQELIQDNITSLDYYYKEDLICIRIMSEDEKGSITYREIIKPKENVQFMYNDKKSIICLKPYYENEIWRFLLIKPSDTKTLYVINMPLLEL